MGGKSAVEQGAPGAAVGAAAGVRNSGELPPRHPFQSCSRRRTGEAAPLRRAPTSCPQPHRPRRAAAVLTDRIAAASGAASGTRGALLGAPGGVRRHVARPCPDTCRASDGDSHGPNSRAPRQQTARHSTPQLRPGPRARPGGCAGENLRDEGTICEGCSSVHQEHGGPP